VKSAWMLVAGLLFAIMGVLVKLASTQFSSAELVFYRSLFGLVMIYWVIRRRHPHLARPFSTQHLRAHLVRSISGFVALLLFFHAIDVLPLATAVTLNYTSPLFLALLLTLWHGEKPHWPLVAGVMLGFCGVVLLLRPSLESAQLSAGLMGLASGFLAGVAYLNLRVLSRMGEPDWAYGILFYAGVHAGRWRMGGLEWLARGQCTRSFVVARLGNVRHAGATCFDARISSGQCLGSGQSRHL